MTAWHLGALIDRSAERFPSRRLSFPSTGESITYPELAARSDRIARGLVAADAAPGEIVALLHPTCADLIATFFGVLKAGGIPTILAKPIHGSSAYFSRIGAILADGGIRVLALHPAIDDEVARHLPAVRRLTTAALEAAGAPGPRQRVPSDVAYVQYTSGSTSNPKGVSLTHDNVRAGIEAIIDAIALCEHDVNGQWVPLHHDMGLIGLLAGIAAGVDHHLWSPTEFLRRPAGWLARFAACRATIYAGPSFGYAYLLAAIDDAAAARLDLSAWRVAFNGSEQVDPRVLEQFVLRFAPAGLRPEVMRPVYGLAEATLAVTIPRQGSVPETAWVDRLALSNEARIVPVARDDAGARGVVCVGPPVRDMKLRIANDGVGPVADRVVAEIQIQGPAVMHAYLGRPRDPDNFTPDGWLRTGDLGYLDAGRLYVTGRRREMIVVRGENYYPGDVEAAVQHLDGIHAERCVAFAHLADDGERLVLLVETTLRSQAERAQLRERVRARLTRDLGLPDVEIALLRVNSIQRTSSGKPQRLAMRDRFVRGELSQEAWQEGGLHA